MGVHHGLVVQLGLELVSLPVIETIVGLHRHKRDGRSIPAPMKSGTRGIMKLLLTSAGVKNKSIHDALVDLLGKPISESSALCIPTAIYAIPGGAVHAWRFFSGQATTPMCELGWKSLPGSRGSAGQLHGRRRKMGRRHAGAGVRD